MQSRRPLKNAIPLAGELLGKVGRAQQVTAVVQIVDDLHLTPGVVAQGHYIGPGVKDLLHLVGQYADTGSVLAIDHGEMDAVLPLDLAQMLAQKRQPLF